MFQQNLIKDVWRIFGEFENLETLDVSDCTWTPQFQLATNSNGTGRTKQLLVKSQIDELEKWITPERFKNLKILICRGSSGIKDEHLGFFALLPKLEMIHLSVGSTHQLRMDISIEGLTKLASVSKSLRTMKFSTPSFDGFSDAWKKDLKELRSKSLMNIEVAAGLSL